MSGIDQQLATYNGIPDDIFYHLNTSFECLGYCNDKKLLRGCLFVNLNTDAAVIIDYRICDKNFPFSYSEYTKEQNSLMHKFSSVYRFTQVLHFIFRHDLVFNYREKQPLKCYIIMTYKIIQSKQKRLFYVR